MDATVDAPAIADAGADVSDAKADAGRDSGQIINCLSCVQTNCGSALLMCVQNQACRDALQCTIQNCFTGGGSGFNPQCILQKCGQNLSGLAGVLAAVTCVTSKCGEQCLSLLGMMDLQPPYDGPPSQPQQ
jgi:hypothetical protein